eukprot:GABW01003041.1.p1 GENE.GABW01003041.1~~GABW01003041.1.p1  ORF type:complete len:143 (-),score=36.22 GABW01003041.1:3-431(-)
MASSDMPWSEEMVIKAGVSPLVLNLDFNLPFRIGEYGAIFSGVRLPPPKAGRHLPSLGPWAGPFQEVLVPPELEDIDNKDKTHVTDVYFRHVYVDAIDLTMNVNPLWSSEYGYIGEVISFHVPVTLPPLSLGPCPTTTRHST